MRFARGPFLVLAALVLLAATMHRVGIDSGLDCPANDEHVYLWHLDLFGKDAERRARDPAYALYPHFIPRLASWTAPGAPRNPPRTPAEHLKSSSSDLIRLRVVVACLSLLVIPATWFAARSFLHPATALLASAFATGSVLIDWHATQARPHAALVGLAWLALALAIEARRRGGAWRWLLCGIATGAALATLQSGLFLLPALVVAHFARDRESRRGELRWLAAALLAALVVALPFYPFLLHPPDPGGAIAPAGAVKFFGHDLWLGGFNGHGFVPLLGALWNYETALTLVVALGGLGALLLSFRAPERRSEDRDRGGLPVLLAFALPYALVVVLYSHTFPRFYIPLVPLLAIFAASSVERVARAAGERALPIAAWAVGPIALLPAANLARLRLVPDTAEETAAWIERNVDRSTERIVVSPSLDLPLLRREAPLPRGVERIGLREYPWRVYQSNLDPAVLAQDGWSIENLPLRPQAMLQRAVDDTAGWARDLRADYAVLEVWDRPVSREIRSWFQAHDELVARFAPSERDRDDSQSCLTQDTPDIDLNDTCWTLRAFSVRRLGKIVEVYRLSRTSAEPR